MFEEIGKLISTIADKDPMVILLIIIILIAVIIYQLTGNKGNSDNYDHKEKASLIDFASASLAESRELRASQERHQQEVKLAEERHHKERVAAQVDTTKAINFQNQVLTQAFKDNQVSIVETIDLTHTDTINQLGGVKSMLAEVRDFVKRFPEMESKVDNILKILENMVNKQNG